MSRIPFLFLAVAICGGAVAVSYKVAPPSQPLNLDVPAIIVPTTPNEVVYRMRSLSMEGFMKTVGISHQPNFVKASTSWVSTNAAQSDFIVGGETLLRVKVTVRAVGEGQSEVDVAAELPDSRLTRSPNLHPYDLKVLAGMADAMATEYVASAIQGRRISSGKEFNDEFQARAGFTDDQEHAFKERIEATVRDIFEPQLQAMKNQQEFTERAWREQGYPAYEEARNAARYGY